MIAGSCLCGGVRFEIARAVGPFELCHCRRCRKASGSPFADWFEVPAGLLDADPGLRPERRIFVELKAPWDDIGDSLPRLDAAAVRALRRKTPP